MYQQFNQNLSQIAQICNQLSSNEQANVTKLQQMVQAEQSAAQQLRHCAQLCQQLTSSLQQMSSTMATAGQFSGYAGAGAGTMPTGNWANRPINTSFAPSPSTSQYGGGQQYGMSSFGGFSGTGKDLGQ